MSNRITKKIEAWIPNGGQTMFRDMTGCGQKQLMAFASEDAAMFFCVTTPPAKASVTITYEQPDDWRKV